MKVLCLFAGMWLLISPAAYAVDQNQSVVHATTTVTKSVTGTPDSKGLAAAEGEFSDTHPKTQIGDAITRGVVVTSTKKTIPEFSGPGNLEPASIVGDPGYDFGDWVPPGAPGGGGTILPKTGSPGETVNVAICSVQHHYKAVYEYQWVGAPHPGHWVVIKKNLTEVASISCD
ncbi:MAG TPA: hypothetical protein VFN13_10430 [Rudaea sp.]|nr:hypothetical protein [Rudaea sp.]